MSAVEELATTKRMLMKLPNISMEEIQDISEQSIATAKLTVIATNETVQAVTELSTSIAQNLLNLLPEKLPLDNLRTDIQILSSQLDRNFQKQNHMLNEMIAFNLQGSNDKRQWQVLQQNFDNYSNQIDEIIRGRDSKYAELNAAMKDLFSKCLKATISLSDLEIKAIASVRKELEMPFDESNYRQIISEANSKMEASFGKFLNEVPESD